MASYAIEAEELEELEFNSVVISLLQSMLFHFNTLSDHCHISYHIVTVAVPHGSHVSGFSNQRNFPTPNPTNPGNPGRLTQDLPAVGD